MLKRMTSPLVMLLALLGAPLLFSGCDQADEGPIREGAEQVEEAAEEIGDGVEEAAEEVGDEIDDATTD